VCPAGWRPGACRVRPPPRPPSRPPSRPRPPSLPLSLPPSRPPSRRPAPGARRCSFNKAVARAITAGGLLHRGGRLRHDGRQLRPAPFLHPTQSRKSDPGARLLVRRCKAPWRRPNRAFGGKPLSARAGDVLGSPQCVIPACPLHGLSLRLLACRAAHAAYLSWCSLLSNLQGRRAGPRPKSAHVLRARRMVRCGAVRKSTRAECFQSALLLASAERVLLAVLSRWGFRPRSKSIVVSQCVLTEKENETGVESWGIRRLAESPKIDQYFCFLGGVIGQVSKRSAQTTLTFTGAHRHFSASYPVP
jgi:hypothetical protein